MRTGIHILLTALTMLGLAGCSEKAPEAEAPPPAELTREAIGQFDMMIVIDHYGPKGQIFIAGQDQPLWFSSVRDTLVFLRLPEETATVRAVYVSDMARAASWENPGDGAWMAAEAAWFVIGSSRVGGMGMPEPVPFSDRRAAEEFANEFGGHPERMADIPDAALMGYYEATSGEAPGDGKEGAR